MSPKCLVGNACYYLSYSHYKQSELLQPADPIAAGGPSILGPRVPPPRRLPLGPGLHQRQDGPAALPARGMELWIGSWIPSSLSLGRTGSFWTFSFFVYYSTLYLLYTLYLFVLDSKSSIFFSPCTDVEVRTEVCSILNIMTEAITDKYLGLPPLVGIDRTDCFQHLIDRVIKLLIGWKEKNMSRKH
jgi:hypothetical protein